jgi:hypothetical protein
LAVLVICGGHHLTCRYDFISVVIGSDSFHGENRRVLGGLWDAWYLETNTVERVSRIVNAETASH